MPRTATERAWDALDETLCSLPSATLARIARGEEAVPKRPGIRALIARNRLDVRALCLLTLANRGEDDTGYPVPSGKAADLYTSELKETWMRGVGQRCDREQGQAIRMPGAGHHGHLHSVPR
jgi:hypothetical protein